MKSYSFEILSRKYGKFKIIIDDEDKKLVLLYTWCINVQKTGYYRIQGKNYKKNWRVSPTKIHRLILGIKDSKIRIDHINGNTLDNRKCNLRICTQGQNLYNLKVNRSNNTSGYKGVSWYNREKRWFAEISANNKKYCLGRFKNKIDAAKAYNIAALKYHGEYACLNPV